MRLDADHELDVTGLYCPEPVMLLHGSMRDIAPGETLCVIATDPTTLRDIPRFCSFLGHDLLQQVEEGGEILFLLRKGV
ncbi:MAG: sulfurtransferase TusA [Haliea sp.]